MKKTDFRKVVQVAPLVRAKDLKSLCQWFESAGEGSETVLAKQLLLFIESLPYRSPSYRLTPANKSPLSFQGRPTSEKIHGFE